MNIDFQALINMRNKQVVNTPYGSKDGNFPLFKTPVNEKLLVYIPTVNLHKNEDGTEYNELLHSANHSYTKGKQFGTITCISGLDENSPVAEMLGYTGHSCPACDAVNECWELVNAKVESIAREMGIDPNNDPEEKLKPSRKKFISEMALSRSAEYVTFPIVVIPHKNLKLTEESMTGMKAYFVTMSKQRYEEKVCASLGTLYNNPGHIAGRFMLWNFTYDTKGNQPTARHSAKNATFSIYTDAMALQAFEKLREPAEEIAKEFTNIKALQVLTAIEPVPYDKIVKEVDSVMSETRKLLALAGAGNEVLPSTPEKALEAFGTTTVESVANTEQNLGVSETAGHRFG